MYSVGFNNLGSLQNCAVQNGNIPNIAVLLKDSNLGQLKDVYVSVIKDSSLCGRRRDIQRAFSGVSDNLSPVIRRRISNGKFCDKYVESIRKFCGLDKKYACRIMQNLLSPEEITEAAKNGSVVAKGVIAYDKELEKALALKLAHDKRVKEEVAKRLAPKDRSLQQAIDNTIIKGGKANKSAQESFEVFEAARKQKLQEEVAKRLAPKDRSLQQAIDNAIIKGGKANKSAQKSFEVFEAARKQKLQEEVAKRLAPKDRSLQQAIDNAIIKGGKANKSAKDAASVFKRMPWTTRIKNEAIYWGKKALSYIKNNKKAFGWGAAIAAVVVAGCCLLKGNKQEPVQQEQQITKLNNGTFVYWS